MALTLFSLSRSFAPRPGMSHTFLASAYFGTFPRGRRVVGNQIDIRERRRHERYPCELIAACGPATGSEEQVWEGKVVEISRGGLLVAVGRRFEAGAILRVRVT